MQGCENTDLHFRSGYSPPQRHVCRLAIYVLSMYHFISVTWKQSSLASIPQLCLQQPPHINQGLGQKRLTPQVQKVSTSHCPMQFPNMAWSRTVTTYCFSEDCWPLTIFLKDLPTGVSGQDLYTFIIRMYVATTESHYCTENKGSKKATGTVPRRLQ